MTEIPEWMKKLPKKGHVVYCKHPISNESVLCFAPQLYGDSVCKKCENKGISLRKLPYTIKTSSNNFRVVVPLK